MLHKRVKSWTLRKLNIGPMLHGLYSMESCISAACFSNRDRSRLSAITNALSEGQGAIHSYIFSHHYKSLDET